MGRQRPRDPRPGQPATDTTKPPPKKTKGEGGGQIPPTATPAHPRATGGPPGRAGANGAHARPHTHCNNPTKRGGAQPKPEPSTQAHTAHPSQERRGTSRERTQTHTRPNTPARSGGARQQSRPSHTPPHRIPNQEVQETTRDGHTSRHTPKHLPKERRGAAEIRTPARTPTSHTRTGGGGVHAKRAHSHARPKTLTKTAGVQAETQAEPQRPQTPAGKRRAKPQTVPELTQDPSQGWRGYRNPNPSTTRTQAQTPHISRKTSVHSPGTEAA